MAHARPRYQSPFRISTLYLHSADPLRRSTPRIHSASPLHTCNIAWLISPNPQYNTMSLPQLGYSVGPKGKKVACAQNLEEERSVLLHIKMGSIPDLHDPHYDKVAISNSIVPTSRYEQKSLSCTSSYWQGGYCHWWTRWAVRCTPQAKLSFVTLPL